MKNSKAKSQIQILLILLWYFQGGLAALSNSFVPRPHFTTDALHKLPLDIGLPASSLFASIADVNSDAYLDLLMFNPLENSLSLLLWSHSDFKFSPTLKLSFGNNEKILNSFFTDFNYDAYSDLFIQFDGYFRVYFGPSFVTPIEFIGGLSGQALLVDMNGDLKPDLLSALDGETQVIFFNGTSFESRKPVESFCLMSPDIPSSFIDLDGDCSADLFLVCQDLTFEIWINGNDKTFTKGSTGKLPDSLAFISFSDVNSDGTMDILLTSCSDTDCTLQIAYNRQMPVCGSKTNGECRPFSNLCLKDEQFYIDMDNLSVFSLSSLTGLSSTILLSNSLAGNPPRFGDFNLDSFPDLILISKTLTGTNITILENVDCSVADKSSGNQCHERGFIKWDPSKTSILADISHSIQQILPFNLDERGSFDILVVSGNQDSNALEVVTVYNNFLIDAYFLKVYTTNGVCFKNCDHPASRKPLGANYPGPVVKYSVLDPLGNKRFSTVSQLSQTTHGSLISPFNLNGLGRTNNYIEDFFVGIPSSSPTSNRITSRNGLIPDSQVLIHPPAADGSTSDWIIELFISPGDYAISVLIVLIVGVVLLGTIVALLRWKERKEDEEERRRALHIINFDAL